ncbi:hypothetical protein [Clostridium tagluense]|uniref:EVE domain-containing protein n=1 Tax=Clostridium tagluense TaxID=360422 RepID=A0A401UUB3_9CLOT|nr:hypothetical protein [Clostridium tagluense]GCD13159.1 hypothetical protein Ctaglu_47820 [Clostridium tagluense]
MSNVYIINTNKKYYTNCEPEMIQGEKCAAYYTPWKEGIDKIKVNDLIFLYSNEVGIIARGVASGICEIKDFNGGTDEEHYMELDRFKKLAIPFKSSEINVILNKTVVLGSTQKKLNYDDGIKIWQNITKKCL